MSRSRTPHERAAACAAVARSTTHAGEREAAIGRCLAICERHGLDPDRFDLPGRPNRRPETVADWAARHRRFEPAPARTTAAYYESLVREVEKTFARHSVFGDDTIYDARRRAFDRECREAKERDRAREEARRHG